MMTTYTATERRSSLLQATSHGGAYGVKALVATIEVAAATTVGLTIDFGRVPSNARILASSQLYWDDLATSGAPTLDLGIGAVNGNLANADDPDALSAGHDTTSAGSASALSEIANAGLQAWDFVASETTDPGGSLMVYGTLADAGVNQVGTCSLELYYVVD
ncbi:MAG: hypothetical protein KOO63_08190 [Bacteroidales bacterium]|nr:hypothetical protein [Candidatus Latescibacterota bacterium]